MKSLGPLLLLFVVSCKQSPAANVPDASAPPEPSDHGFKAIGGIEGENPGFDRQREPGKIVAALGLKPGQRVADVGAGRGYLTFRLADAVGPSGHVLATDVDDDAVATLKLRAAARPEITVRQVQPDVPGLEPGAYDLILMSEVDHFLSDRVAFLRHLKTALAPGGRLAVTHTRALRAPLEAAAKEAGFAIQTDFDGLSDHYLLIFVSVAP